MLVFDKFATWQRAAGYTDEQVAQIARCHNTSISRVKRGEIFLRPEKRQRICDASGGALRPSDFAEFEAQVVRVRASARRPRAAEEPPKAAQ